MMIIIIIIIFSLHREFIHRQKQNNVGQGSDNIFIDFFEVFNIKCEIGSSAAKSQLDICSNSALSTFIGIYHASINYLPYFIRPHARTVRRVIMAELHCDTNMERIV